MLHLCSLRCSTASVTARGDVFRVYLCRLTFNPLTVGVIDQHKSVTQSYTKQTEGQWPFHTANYHNWSYFPIRLQNCQILLQSKCALSTAECGIFKIISSYFFIFLLSVSLALSLSLCLSVLELMAEFKMLIHSLNIRVLSLSPPPCQHLHLIHCSDEHLIYIITAAQASFLSHKYTYTSTHLTVNYYVWPSRPETAAWSTISTHTHHHTTEGCDLTSHSSIFLLHLSRCYFIPPLLHCSFCPKQSSTPIWYWCCSVCLSQL